MKVTSFCQYKHPKVALRHLSAVCPFVTNAASCRCKLACMQAHRVPNLSICITEIVGRNVASSEELIN